jgi:phosphatidylethanolamine-binding protein (PEBP) family uncharacterized protein
VHWLVYGIPPEVDGLPEASSTRPSRTSRPCCARARTAIGNVGYDGPLGTMGKTIRYRFTLCALDRPLDLPPGEGKEAVARAMSGHVLDEAQLLVIHEHKG